MNRKGLRYRATKTPWLGNSTRHASREKHVRGKNDCHLGSKTLGIETTRDQEVSLGILFLTSNQGTIASL